MPADVFRLKREQLVAFLEQSQAIRSREVREAFLAVPREAFFPVGAREQAYVDAAFPIGHGQTISQPSTLASMLELLQVRPGQKVLEVGSGCGYVLALLAHLVGAAGKVFGVELLEELAGQSKNSKIEKLPRPMMFTKDYDFSFSGLKTAVLYADKKIKVKDQKYKENMSQEVQQAIIDVLLKKTLKAVKDFKAKSLILGGGVSANKKLRETFKKALKDAGVRLFVPEPVLSTDNALMIAVAGYFHRNKKAPWKTLEAYGNLRIG